MSFPFVSDLIRHFTGLDIWFPIPFFGLMVAASLFVGVLAVKSEARRLFKLGKIGEALIKDPTAKPKPGAPVKMIRVPPEQIVADLCFVTAIAGMIGARLFHILENLDQFMADPTGMIFTRAGFTILGGLILGVPTGVWFVNRAGLRMSVMLDAAAPALILGYGVGRIGCQIAGDGDWGIPADMALKPDWLPDFLWASQYIGNIVGENIPAPGVYPTPLYETLMCFAIFGILWLIRKHPFKPGWLFAVYMLLAGIERFAVELIRINVKFNVFGMNLTQAEMISAVLIVAGLIGIVNLSKRDTAVIA